MFSSSIQFNLPKPWNNERFKFESLGAINYLVGPNGAGKSRFAETLKDSVPTARLLGSNRLQGMNGPSDSLGMFGDNFATGFKKEWFGNFRLAGTRYGSGIDAFVILEESPEVRVLVEATLSHLFDREIELEWNSGNLIPKAFIGKNREMYRLDRDECHGIRELLVILTHLYSETHTHLIIDEPELNLHPQFQSFLMQEFRKIAGDPAQGKKCLFLITHSPFMVDLHSEEDLSSIYCFSSDFVVPRSLAAAPKETKLRLASLLPRLNVYHKQLFFSDNPIFVEGISDAGFIEAVQERRGLSISTAGSCIIQAGGCEETNKYVELCRYLGKSAYFLYDLDSLFLGTLRQCVSNDENVGEFLADLGVGTDFCRYCGELDRKLTDAIKQINVAQEPSARVAELQAYFLKLEVQDKPEGKNLARARVAVLIDLNQCREEVVNVISESLAKDIEGRLSKIVEILGTKKIFLLNGGELEHYLPSCSGNRYELSDGAKKTAVESELKLLSQGILDTELATRYGALFKSIALLPAKGAVDIKDVLNRYLSSYIHHLQQAVIAHPGWNIEEMRSEMTRLRLEKLFQIDRFTRSENNKFNCRLTVLGTRTGFVAVSHSTNAGMQEFELVLDN